MTEPVWISHRGYCRAATENTADAFRAALAQGFTHLETDLRSTADGHLVLAHDMDLARISDVATNVCESTRAQLEYVVLNGGQPLLFFDEFMAEFSGHRWIFDIKPEYGLRTLDLVLQWWRKPEYADFFRRRVRFLLWKKSQQDYLLQHHPEAVCMATIRECRRAGVACLLGLPALGGIRPGVTYALRGRLTKVGSRAFLVVPDGTELAQDELHRLEGLGYRMPTGSDA
jgi:glycerophosphoryl diester phosphodiesterase